MKRRDGVRSGLCSLSEVEALGGVEDAPEPRARLRLTFDLDDAGLTAFRLLIQARFGEELPIEKVLAADLCATPKQPKPAVTRKRGNR